MVDFAKKITKSCSDDLEEGETVLAGTFVQPPGAIRRQVAFGAIGGVVGAVVGDKLAQKRAAETPSADEGIVVDIPPGKAVLGITDRRFLVFGHSTMSVSTPRSRSIRSPRSPTRAASSPASCW